MSRIKLVLCLCVVACFCISAGSTAYCQSKEETKKYILRRYESKVLKTDWKSNLKADKNAFRKTETYTISFSGDTLVVTVKEETDYYNRIRNYTQIRRYSVALKDLNPSRVDLTEPWSAGRMEPSPYHIMFYVTEEKRKIKSQLWWEDRKKWMEPDLQHAFHIGVHKADGDVARRLQRAFAHLIKQCGGEDEMF